MNTQIILPSGNVVPALSEQDHYRELFSSILRGTNPDNWRFWRGIYLKDRLNRPKRKLRRWDISDSGESCFVQNGYETKEVDQNKADWREKKGFTQDYRRSTRSFWRKKWASTQQNRSERREVKRQIFNEDYDAIRTHAYPRNHWLWD